MPSAYFSDRERGPRPRTSEEISEAAWGGFIALIGSLIDTGAFGIDFPEACPDGRGTSGTSANAFYMALQSEVPDLDPPFRAGDVPPTLDVLDLIEFCHSHVASPQRGSYHSYYGHYHLDFDRDLGQSQFRDRVNTIMARNGIAFELRDDGQFSRLAPPVLREQLAMSEFDTGDEDLDALLESARTKFLSPDPNTRREALEKLWDAWERAKTLEDGSDKKASATALLDKASSEPTLRAALEAEAKEITRIGNTFSIRHSETSQIALERSEHVDYLFHRLFALLLLVLRCRE